VNESTALLEPVRFLASPHHDARPVGIQIDMVVIHGISLPPGEFGTRSIEDFFCGHLDFNSNPAFKSIEGMRVSSHLLIKRTGEIIQFVPFALRAWHAGQSSFQGRSGCNDFSIGIELEGTDTIPYELAQYEQLVRILNAIKVAYPAVTDDRIVGHSDIAPGRKTDPGSVFDWHYLKLKGITA
jgi:AmpD protein